MSLQVITAHPDDAVTTLKLLKRVCNQHRTGIRKHFCVLGRICHLELGFGGIPNSVWIVFDDEPGGRAYRLSSVTPESILEKIHVQICSAVMDT